MNMKAKLFFTLLILLSQTVVSLAEEKPIKVDKDKWTAIRRTLLIPPVLTHVDNTVFLYSDLPLENMEVTVTDASGQIAYMDILTVGAGAGETISFTFDVSMESEYLIEIRHAGKYLCGWFEL